MSKANFDDFLKEELTKPSDVNKPTEAALSGSASAVNAG